MKIYTTYKDSGIEWIGSIPEHWECSKLGWVYPNMGSGTTPDTNNPNYYVEDGFNWLQTGDLTDGKITSTSKHLSTLAVEEKRMKFYPIGSIVIAMYGATIGKVGYLDIESTTNQACCVLPPQDNLDNMYMFYLVQSSKATLISKSVGGGQPNISQAIIQMHKIPVPPLAEQEAIVAYLDDKVGKIDSSVAAINSQIDDLKAYRQSVISEIVTKGLNPNASMKDSGIQWIGTIPEHWETRRIKMLSPVKRGASPRPIDDPKYFDENGQYSWVRIADVSSSSKYLYTTSQRLSELGARLSVKQHPGDIFISIAGSVGKPIITKIDCCIHDGFVWFPNLEYNKELLYYIFESGRPYLGLGKTGTQLNLNTDSIGNIRIPVPPLAEQEAIAKYLDEKTSLIDKVIKELEAQRDDLNTLKQSIISEAVTGKIDVRDWKKA